MYLINNAFDKESEMKYLIKTYSDT